MLLNVGHLNRSWGGPRTESSVSITTWRVRSKRQTKQCFPVSEIYFAKNSYWAKNEIQYLIWWHEIMFPCWPFLQVYNERTYEVLFILLFHNMAFSLQTCPRVVTQGTISENICFRRPLLNLNSNNGLCDTSGCIANLLPFRYICALPLREM